MPYTELSKVWPSSKVRKRSGCSSSFVVPDLRRPIKLVAELLLTQNLRPERASLDSSIQLDAVTQRPLMPEQFNVLVIRFRSARRHSLGAVLLRLVSGCRRTVLLVCLRQELRCQACRLPEIWPSCRPSTPGSSWRCRRRRKPHFGYRNAHTERHCPAVRPVPRVRTLASQTSRRDRLFRVVSGVIRAQWRA